VLRVEILLDIAVVGAFGSDVEHAQYASGAQRLEVGGIRIIAKIEARNDE